MKVAIGVLLAISVSAGALAQDASNDLVGHVYYGKMILRNDDPAVAGGDYEIDIFGLDVQKALQSGTITYGYETGGLLSIDSEVRRFRASSGEEGGTVELEVDINSILVDYFFGGYVGIAPARWFRLFAGAGPLITWASRETDLEATDEAPASSDSESGWGLGLYLRAGADLLFTDTFGIHAGARVTETTLSFEDTSGDVDLEGWQYYIGMAFRF